MKNFILFILAAIFAANCSKQPYVFSHDEIIGKRYLNSTSEIEFLSKDTLLWTISINRESPKSYKIAYEISQNEINFAAQDTTKTIYRDPITNSEGFIRTYFSDSFDGSFTDLNSIDAKLSHSSTEYVDDLYIQQSRGYNLSLVFRSNN